MNRTLRIDAFTTGSSVLEDGRRVAVLDRFVHPERGPVQCPAAPVLAADLGRSFPESASAAVASLGVHVRGERTTVCVTYLDRDGHAVGLAVGAESSDDAAIAAAHGVIRRWAAVMRTRRVLIADAPPCDGLECPQFPKARASVLEFAGRGDAVVLIGRADSRVAHALCEDARRSRAVAHIVARSEDVSALACPDPDALSFVVVPGTPIEEAQQVLTALRARYPRLRGQHPDEYCYHASDRVETLRSIRLASDTVLLLDPTADVAEGGDASMVRITDAADLRPHHVAFPTIGLVDSGGAGGSLHEEVLSILAGLGPLSVAYRRMLTTLDRCPAASAAPTCWSGRRG